MTKIDLKRLWNKSKVEILVASATTGIGVLMCFGFLRAQSPSIKGVAIIDLLIMSFLGYTLIDQAMRKYGMTGQKKPHAAPAPTR